PPRPPPLRGAEAAARPRLGPRHRARPPRHGRADDPPRRPQRASGRRGRPRAAAAGRPRAPPPPRAHRLRPQATLRRRPPRPRRPSGRRGRPRAAAAGRPRDPPPRPAHRLRPRARLRRRPPRPRRPAGRGDRPLPRPDGPMIGLHRPGTSLFHRLPAGVKLLGLLLAGVGSILVRTPTATGVVLGAVLAGYAVARM